MSNFIRVRSNGDILFDLELVHEIENSGLPAKKADNIVAGVSEIIVTLGSAGIFTAFYKVLLKVLDKNKNRQITIQNKETSISITGHSLPEEKELLKMIAPHLLEDPGANKGKVEGSGK
jgi:hypothetical protein